MVSSLPHLRRGLAALCCLLALFALRPAAAATLVLNTDGEPPHSRPDGSGFEDRIVAEAFRRAGLGLKVVHLPAERCLQNVIAGFDDGNYVRVGGLARQFHALVMVEEPVSAFPFTAFTRDPALRLSSWEDLRGRRVAYVTGWKLVEKHTRGLEGVKHVRDEAALFALLDSGRADVVISGLHTGREMIRAKGYKGMRALTPPLSNAPMHIYLNRRHEALAPKISEALRGMKRDGTFQRLMREGLREAAP